MQSSRQVRWNEFYRRLNAALAAINDPKKSWTGAVILKFKWVWSLLIPLSTALMFFFSEPSKLDLRFAIARKVSASGIRFSIPLLALIFFGMGAEFFILFQRTDPRHDTDPTLPKAASTQRLLSDIGGEHLAIGTAIEVRAHPHRGTRLRRIGWLPEKVEIIYRKDDFVSDERLLAAEVQDDREIKFALIHLDGVLADDPRPLRLTVARTNWPAIQAARQIVTADERLRHELISLDPQSHHIPHSLCLHFVCLTAEDDFLALRRKPDVAYYPGALSISFEEQLSPDDIAAGESNRVAAWFRRSICEELFPMTGYYTDHADLAWEEAYRHVDLMRICSCFLEEDSGNFSVFGVVKLKRTRDEFIEVFRGMARRLLSVRDDEGRLYVLPKSEVLNLLNGEIARATALFNSNRYMTITDPEHQMHPTALYRAAIIMKSI